MRGPSSTRQRFRLDDAVSEFETEPTEILGEYHVRAGVISHRVRMLSDGPGPRVALVDGRVLRLAIQVRGDTVIALRSGVARKVELDVAATTVQARTPPRATGELVAPMPGRVLAVQVGLGQRVEQGTPLLLIEAMKMQNQLFAGCAGVVSRILVEAGMVVERGALLVRIE